MRNDEVFFLHLNGEQKGPYTVAHIDHQLQCGLINEETLYWREGMEQWELVTRLVGRRRGTRRSWKHGRKILWTFLFIGAFTLLFGGTIRTGWREMRRRDYTPTGAYWRARGVVRLAVPGVLEFHPAGKSKVALRDGQTAEVHLRGKVASGAETRDVVWRVKLKHGGEVAGWSAEGTPEEIGP